MFLLFLPSHERIFTLFFHPPFLCLLIYLSILIHALQTILFTSISLLPPSYSGFFFTCKLIFTFFYPPFLCVNLPFHLIPCPQNHLIYLHLIYLHLITSTYVFWLPLQLFVSLKKPPPTYLPLARLSGRQGRGNLKAGARRVCEATLINSK